jgi:hypothetical protein
LAVQPLLAGHARPPGTAHAVLTCRDALGGSFAVVNADDLYPSEAFALLAQHLRAAPDDEHALVAFPVARTLISDRPVSRALIEVDGDARLTAIREGTVRTRPDGLRFEASGTASAMCRDASVSMNMWGFRPSIFEVLARAVAAYVAAPDAEEVRLPDVAASLVTTSGTVRVLRCDADCIGLTHPEDLPLVAAALA